MKELTKERLLELGVTDVTEDGLVYVNGKLKSQAIARCKHNNGNHKEYPFIQFPDKTKKVYYNHKYKVKSGESHTSKWWTWKTIAVPVGRLVLAWFHGSIGANEDADHIDNDPFNNHLSNLRPISRRENLAKRLLDHPDYKYTYFNQWHNLKK